MFNAINLDDLSIDPMDFRVAACVLRQLAEYAELRACALEERLAGRVREATDLDRRLDSMYTALPEWARW